MGSGAPQAGLVPATTVPVMVVKPPSGQVTWFRHRLVHGLPPSGPASGPSPQTPGTPPPPQMAGLTQLPQPPAMTPPHPSPAAPQVSPSWAQVLGTQTAGAPHWLKTPPPPQVWGEGQPPVGSQLRRAPQPSPAGPQPMPSWAQVLGTQLAAPPHWLAMPPPPQVWGEGQPPGGSQLRMAPQPSPVGPQAMPSWAQVLGVHAGAPHCPSIPPPPQVWPPGQPPGGLQSRVAPQPSPAGPQAMP